MDAGAFQIAWLEGSFHGDVPQRFDVPAGAIAQLCMKSGRGTRKNERGIL